MTTQGATLINQLASIEKCIASNQECCTRLLAEIKRVEAKVDAVPKVDPASIIKQAVSAVLSSPEWLLGIGAVGAIRASSNEASKVAKLAADRSRILGNSLDNLKYSYNQLGERVNTVSNTANNAKVATDSLGRTVLDNSNRLGDFQSKLVSLDQRVGGALSRIQQINSNVNGVLSKLTPLFSILSIVGALAGLASLAGILYTVFPRLDAHDYQLQVQERGLNEAQTRSINAELASRKAQDDANKANNRANAAIETSNTASRKADVATDKANKAIEKANANDAKIDTVENRMNSKFDYKFGEIDKGVRAIHADFVNRLGLVVTGFTSGLNGAVREYLFLNDIQGNQIRDAEGRANKAVDDANYAAGKADAATEKANRAITASNEAKAIAVAQTDKADRAIAEANKANNTSIAATATAGAAVVIAQSAANNNQKPLQNISVNQAAANVQQQFADINKSVQTQLGQAQRDFQTTASNLRKEFETTTRGFQQQIGNLIIPSASAAEPVSDTRIESVIQKSPTVQRLGSQTNSNTASITNLNTQTTTKITQLETQIRTQETVNQAGNQKLDIVNSKLDNLASSNTQQTTILGGIQDVLKGVQNAIKDFANKINNLINQFNIVISQINGLVAKLNTFISSVNNYLRNILNYVIAILAALVFLRPIILLISVRVGTILARLVSLAKWLRLDRAWNMLIYAGVMHNAFMLSNSFSQTLLSATNAFLKAFVLTDDQGENFDAGQVLGKQIKETTESIFGAKTVAYWEVQWKKFNRVYQATANIINRLTNIHSAIFTVLEILSSRISKVANALRSYGVVGEKAYEKFNESDNFQHPFFIRMQRLQEGASSIEIVSSSVSTVKSEYKSLQTDSKEFTTAINKATAQDQKADEAEIKKILAAKVDEAAVQ